MQLKQTILNSSKPFVIAGPCSAETPEQVMQTCEALVREKKVRLFRAGIWKPRTRPDSFEGVGAIGLQWLVDAGKKFNIPVTTEVANIYHVESALKAGVDVLWIGARTTVNPFAVQEIADALKGVNIPVMVKNPVNPDIDLWLGAIERIEKAGIKDLIAIHRGFSVYKHRKYRNVPSWEIPIALNERRNDIPLICDPSHITGKSELLLEISQKAMDLNFDGLMIETHPHPADAWSDAAQQITPSELSELLNKLVLRQTHGDASSEFHLQEFREQIEILDDRLFEILAERMKISEKVGEFKRKNNITILQPEHWAKMIGMRLSKANDYGLTNHFIRQTMDAIHQESIRQQTKIMNPNISKDFK